MRRTQQHKGGTVMERQLSTVILEKISGTGVARIIFNRPEKRNAVNG